MQQIGLAFLWIAVALAVVFVACFAVTIIVSTVQTIMKIIKQKDDTGREDNHGNQDS